MTKIEYITLTELAKRLGIERKTLYKNINEFECITVGKRRKYLWANGRPLKRGDD